MIIASGKGISDNAALSLEKGFNFIWQRLDVDIIVAAVLTFSKKQFGEVRELGPCLPSSRSEKMNI